MKMRKIQLNLRWKILLVVSIGLLIAYGATGAIRIYQVKKSFIEETNRSGQERATLIADAVANMIVGYDYGNLEAVANRIVKFQDIRKINIINRDGKLMVTRDARDFDTDQADQENLSNFFVAPVYFAGDKVGSVELIVSRDRFSELIKISYRNIFFAILLSLIFFSILIYSTVSVFIVRPLLKLSKAADQLALGNYAAELPHKSRDEIGKLISAFSKMRESRKDSEARLQAVFDNSPDAFIQLDNNGNIIDWSEKAVFIWGYQKSEVLGKNFSIVMPDPELGMNPGYQRCYQKSENLLGAIREAVGKRKKGSFFPLELRTSEINFEEGSAFLVLARDISARKKNENKLMQAMSAAEAANAAKSAFLSNMSHEIRTPMNSIIGMTKLASKTPLNAKQRDYLSKIDYAANHLLDLINDILDFSKIEANKLELEKMNFELSSLFKGLSGQLAHSAASKGLTLRFELDDALSIPLLGDPMRLLQVLLNFASNAIKFSNKGEVLIRGQLLEDYGLDLLVLFEVTDEGIGLSKEIIQTLFKPFQQADSSTTRQYGGTGLGLAICKQLVELMHGTIGVESQLGVGSKFWFTARFAKGVELNPMINDAPMADLSVLKGISILVVEDNPFNQQIAVELLGDVGVAVSIANNGQEAIDMLLAQCFDCVLMDVQMPVMDGFEATRQIRSNPALAGICIIAMTANVRKEDREHCFAVGMDNFIGKPVFADNLYKVIAETIFALHAHRAKSNERNLLEPATLDIDTAPFLPGLQSVSDGGTVLLDLSVLGKMLGSDPVKINKFALKFLQSAQLGLAEIEQALNDADMEKLAALGHRNKSPARTVGANSYAQLCQSLEQFKGGGSIEVARKIVEQMRQLIVRIEVQINKEISQ